MMRAYAQMKANVDAVLKARGFTREDLSKYCRRESSWASKILTNDKRWFPVPYWDRISDFLGLAPYQLMQPGISPLTERRKGLDRRTGLDRRKSAINHRTRESVSNLIATITPVDVADLIRLRGMSETQRAAARRTWDELPRSRPRTRGPAPAMPPVGPVSRAEAPAEMHDGAAQPKKRTKG